MSKDTKICPSSAHHKWKGSSRTNVNYWRHRVEHSKGSSGSTNPHLSARITYKGRRARFNLETANKDQAAAKAATIFRHILEFGWDEALKKYRPDSLPVKEVAKNAVSVGEFVTAVEKISTVRSQTFRAYTQAFRKIVAQIAEIPSAGKHTLENGEVGKKWRIAVDAVPLSDITPVKIQEWRQRKLRENEGNALQQRRALTTVASSIQNAKSLFKAGILSQIAPYLELPSPLPFDGIMQERPKASRYQSRIDASTILKKATSELAGEQPECYKVILLSLVLGLRVSEIDHMEWTKFDFEGQILRIEDSEFHRLKSEHSAGELDLDDETVEIFKLLKKSSKSRFVVESDSPDATSKNGSRGVYRCQKAFDQAIAFLRANGVSARKPIHELRKEVGSIIASSHGIFAASRYLRHGDIQITAAVYADKKSRVTAGIKFS